MIVAQSPFGKKMKQGKFSNEETKGIFLVQNKKDCEKYFQFFFQRNLTYSSQKLKSLIFKTSTVLFFDRDPERS